MFRLNQRVKLARPRKPENLGKTGIIHAFVNHKVGDATKNGVLMMDTNCLILWDNDPIPWAQHTDQLEPLWKDNVPADWDALKKLGLNLDIETLV